ncbi:MAG: class I SAM-dependent methyltransferase [Lentilitoribacter sp.]
MSDNKHFEQGGANYALSRPTYPASLATELANLCELKSHAVDIGCGTGQLSVLLASEFDKVTAIDPSASQIENAQQNQRVKYGVHSAEDTQIEDASADLVVAAQAAHWFDLDKFYTEVKRIIRPKGILALISYGVPELEGAIGKRFDKFYWKEIYHFWPEGRKHVERGYQDLNFPFEEFTLSPLAIERSWNRDQFLNYIDTWSAKQKAKEAGDLALFKAYSDELASVWPDDQTQKVRWPITARITRMA